METNKYKNHSNRVWSGLILLIIGAVFLLRNFGFDIPYWVFNWPTLLILIGLVIGFKRRFNGGGWLVMVLVGGYFTLQNITDFNLTQYYIGAGFVVLGLYIIFKPARPDKERWQKKFKNYNWNDYKDCNYSDYANAPADPLNNPEGPQAEPLHNQASDRYTRDCADRNDYIDAVNIFAGSKRQVYSKNLKGGDVVSVFGGCDLDLTQADFQGNVSIDIVAIFGGVKLIIPPTWVVRSEVSPIFGGLEDKRAVMPATEEPLKIITIKGVALFGGVTISNY
ncbi:LiaF transmembrane domain-containing protein [Pedobacter sp. NJ-S-72]